jgi:hypothetical protein
LRDSDVPQLRLKKSKGSPFRVEERNCEKSLRKEEGNGCKGSKAMVILGVVSRFKVPENFRMRDPTTRDEIRRGGGNMSEY